MFGLSIAPLLRASQVVVAMMPQMDVNENEVAYFNNDYAYLRDFRAREIVERAVGVHIFVFFEKVRPRAPLCVWMLPPAGCPHEGPPRAIGRCCSRTGCRL